MAGRLFSNASRGNEVRKEIELFLGRGGGPPLGEGVR